MPELRGVISARYAGRSGLALYLYLYAQIKSFSIFEQESRYTLRGLSAVEGWRLQ